MAWNAVVRIGSKGFCKHMPRANYKDLTRSKSSKQPTGDMCTSISALIFSALCPSNGFAFGLRHI